MLYPEHSRRAYRAAELAISRYDALARMAHPSDIVDASRLDKARTVRDGVAYWAGRASDAQTEDDAHHAATCAESGAERLRAALVSANLRNGQGVAQLANGIA